MVVAENISFQYLNCFKYPAYFIRDKAAPTLLKGKSY